MKNPETSHLGTEYARRLYLLLFAFKAVLLVGHEYQRCGEEDCSDYEGGDAQVAGYFCEEGGEAYGKYGEGNQEEGCYEYDCQQFAYCCCKSRVHTLT